MVASEKTSNPAYGTPKKAAVFGAYKIGNTGTEAADQTALECNFIEMAASHSLMDPTKLTRS